MSFKFSALFSVIIGKQLGLDWLVRSHSRISVGASRGPIWIVTKNQYLSSPLNPSLFGMTSKTMQYIVQNSTFV